ncbi:hypothetical protein OUZ56_000290 [Daphnia magna]|uniref:Uncharacterized protein n=1 Tax=Daphnia magna TaxID=35525 RepID=A0ABQ9ZZ81_9CRUS|nr:hypothetical protein OUZ56_000290 [Daphnia magna]
MVFISVDNSRFHLLNLTSTETDAYNGDNNQTERERVSRTRTAYSGDRYDVHGNDVTLSATASQK